MGKEGREREEEEEEEESDDMSDVSQMAWVTMHFVITCNCIHKISANNCALSYQIKLP